MIRRLFLVVVGGLFTASSPASAQLDPETKQPYLWRIVLATKPHPLISDDFRDRVKRDIFAALQTGLGSLGTVEVIDLADPAWPRDKWDPLWQQFDDKGFAALDLPRDLTGTKTQFLRVEYREGRFHLEARQYDGFTGLCSPLVRSQSVHAPEQVGRVAGILLDRDFGVVGTVEPLAGLKDEVKVILRGANLGPVQQRVQRGDILALSGVRKTNRPAPVERTATGKIKLPPPGTIPPPALTSTPRDFTLLRVTDVMPDGTLRCTVLTRYENALPLTGGIIGYRCMKLGTVKAPVAIRLIRGDGTVNRTALNIEVRANDTAFPNPADPNPREVCKFNPITAQFHSERPLAGVACITVAQGRQVKQFPVPILSDQPISLPFDDNPATADRAEYERAVYAAAAATADARLSQTVCFETVTRLLNKQTKAGNKEALDHAQRGFETADAAYKSLSDELARLKEQLDKSPNAAPMLERIEHNLAALHQYNQQLEEHIRKIKKVVERENNPALAAREVQAEELNARIALLLSNGEAEQALAAYDQLILLLPENPELKERRDKLAAEWKIKDAAHQQARDYLLKTWPTVATIPDFKDNLDKIRAAVDTCKAKGDRLTLRKLLTIFVASRTKLQDLAAALDGTNEADRKLIADATEVGKRMAALEKEIVEFVK
jgi:tetratricopeptide (TPR) repeat protein